MEQIDNISQLEALIFSTNVIKIQQIEELNIKIINENLSKKLFEKLIQLHQIIPRLVNLRVNIIKANLDGQFLYSLQSVLGGFSNLKVIYLNLENMNFPLKRIKQFMLFINSKFFPEEQISYCYSNSQIFMVCSTCRIGFQYLPSDSSSLWIKCRTSKKIEVQIGKEQEDFLKIIRKANKKEIENLEVELCYQNNLLVSCNNCSQSSQLVLKLIFEDASSLFQFPIYDHFFVEINLSANYFEHYDKSSLRHQISTRQNVSFKNNSSIVLLSFQSGEISRKKELVLKQKLQMFNLNFNNTMILNTPFKLNFYFQYILPEIKKNQNTKPYQINFYLNQETSTGQSLLLNIKSRTECKIARDTLSLEFQSINDVLECIKNFYDSCQESDQNTIKVGFYCKSGLAFKEKQQFIDDLSQIDTKDTVKKLSIKCVRRGELLKYSLISSLKQLRVLTIHLLNTEELLSFFRENVNHLNSGLINSTLFSLKVFPESQERLQESYFLKQQFERYLSKQIVTHYNRIYEIILMNSSQEIPWIYRQLFYQLKRLVKVSFQYPEKWERYYYDHYEYQWENRRQKWQSLLKSENERLQFSYQLVDFHDDIRCSYTRKEQCICNDKQIQEILQRPDQYFLYLLNTGHLTENV